MVLHNHTTTVEQHVETILNLISKDNRAAGMQQRSALAETSSPI
jgi:hypothetical protein